VGEGMGNPPHSSISWNIFMDYEQETANIIAEAVRRTRTLREELITLLNNSSCGVLDGSLALITMATAHLKEEDISEQDFLELCKLIYKIC
jgi:hypothetical protein